MTRNIADLLKPVQTQGTLLTHGDKMASRVKEFFWSTFLEKSGILIKGEFNNKDEKGVHFAD